MAPAIKTQEFGHHTVDDGVEVTVFRPTHQISLDVLNHWVEGCLSLLQKENITKEANPTKREAMPTLQVKPVTQQTRPKSLKTRTKMS